MTRTEAQRLKTERQIDAIGKAREQGYQLFVEAYCDSSGACSAREVAIHIKDHDETLLNQIRKNGLSCPLCQGKLKLHWVRTPEEHYKIEEQTARWSVNSQMRRRDVAVVDPTALFVETASDMCDDRLPPTPDNYFDHSWRPNMRRRKFISSKD